MIHLIKNKLNFLKACFPTMVSRAHTNINGEFKETNNGDVIDLSALSDFIRVLGNKDIRFYFDKFIIDYINNDSDLLYKQNVLSCKTKKVLLTEKNVVNEKFSMIDIIRVAFNSK